MNKYIYSPFYWGLLKEFKLKPDEALFLTLIQSLSKKQGCCYASKSYLANTMNVSTPTIYKFIRDLTKKELIEKGGKSRQNTLELKVSELCEAFILEINKEIQENKERKQHKKINNE